MRALTRKLGRELWSGAGMLLSVIGIIAVGTGCFVGLGSAVRILSGSQEAYYRAYRFADFWVHIKKAPLSAVDRIAELPGVAAVQGRVVFDVIIDVPDETRPLTGRLISTPEQGYADVINGVCIVRGGGFSHDRNEEVILSEAFAAEHDLDPGDRIELILNRKRQQFAIVGTAISPEYVYMVRGSGDIVPDPEHFGILYVKEDYARDVLDFRNACNEITGRLVPGTEDDVDFLLERMERMLEPYGVLSTTPRERQASHRFLSDEINGVRISSTVIPAIFLLVAALVLNILMSRLAERQRAIIGTLKALGYGRRDVLLHFVSFGLVVGLVGGLAGNLVGVWMAASMVEMYKGFFQFPNFVYELYPDLLLGGLLISVVFAAGGTAKGVWTVLQLEPAEAMRPKPPERGGAIFLERWPWLWRRLGFRTHIALRGLFRNRVRTATAVFATSLATSMIILALVLNDSLWYMVEYQYDKVAHSDVDIGLRDERSLAALDEARHLPAVDYAEPLLALVCDLQHGRRERRVAITGLSDTHRLTTPMTADLQPVVIPPEGLVLARKLAELLDARVGDTLRVTPVRGRRQTVDARVASIVDTFVGLDCYAGLGYLSDLVGEALAMNAAQLEINPARRDALFRAVKCKPNAQGLNVAADTKQTIRETLVGTMSTALGVIVVFAGMIAFGSIVNNALVEIGDRIREIATFRVLGYRPTQVAAIFFRQNAATFVAGLVFAAPISYGLIVVLARAYDTELFRMPMHIRPGSVVLAVLLAFAFVVLAQLIVYWQIRKLDWLEGIKVKE